MTRVVIGFSQPKGCMIGAEVIKLWMGTPYSHVYLRVYSSYTEQWLVYQASHGMVNCLTYTAFSATNNTTHEYSVDVSDEALRSTVRKAQQLLGQPYGYFGLLRLVLRRLEIPVVGDGLKSSHCSEFIATLFPDLAERAGITADYIEPVHLQKVLSLSKLERA